MPSDMIQDMTCYEEAKNFLMLQLAPDCNQMTLKHELASITPEVGEEPAAFLSKCPQCNKSQNRNRGATHPPKPSQHGSPTYVIYPNQQFLAPWEQHIHYNDVPAPYFTTPTDSSRPSSQSSELQLALPALPPSTTISMTALDRWAINQSTSAANMVIPSKEIASAAPIVSPWIVCWNATSRAFQDPCHIRSFVCQIDNLTPSSKTFVRKYASMRAFQIPIKL
uniref:Uncharacterized protein n=1 Tax=Romanomermis culicivorax TaxID=13658 RepID=A0A915JUN0_ROMCU